MCVCIQYVFSVCVYSVCVCVCIQCVCVYSVCLCVCVCVCIQYVFSVCVYSVCVFSVCMCVYSVYVFSVCMCLCMCVYVCVFSVCMCVCVDSVCGGGTGVGPRPVIMLSIADTAWHLQLHFSVCSLCHDSHESKVRYKLKLYNILPRRS